MLAHPLVVSAAVSWVDEALIGGGVTRDLMAIRQEWVVSEGRAVDFIS